MIKSLINLYKHTNKHNMQFNKTIILIFAFLMVGAISCNEERLDVEPVNEFLSENFYSSEDQVWSALIAAYDPLGWSMGYGNWISSVMFNEIRSDNVNAGGDPSDNDQPGWQEFDDFSESNSNNVINGIYKRNYIGIFRANLVIYKPEIESALVERYQAEAKFLRAYYHFELFKFFGPIPVVNTLLTPEDINEERNTMTEVFTAIVSDLEEAIPVLPTSISSSEAGRATKGAAQALLGKVFLYWADMDGDDPAKFDLAADYLNEVVNSGIYTLEDDFASLFLYGVKNPAESVLEIQHTNLWASDWGWMEGIDGNGLVQLCGIRGICDDHPDYAPGWGFMLPTQSLSDHFLADDQYRRDAAIIDLDELEEEIVAAGGDCDIIVDLTQGNSFDFAGFWQQKFANWKDYLGNNVNGGSEDLTKDANVYAIRYADVLLMLAESLERGTGSGAGTYVDMVRERAFGPGDNTGNYRTAQQLMSDEGWNMLDVIRYERRAEFAIEGDRWFDLVRSGRASSDLFSEDPAKAGNFSEERLWLPISLEETDVAPNLTTYPGAELFN